MGVEERKRPLRHEGTSGLAVLISDYIQARGLAAGTHLSAQELAEEFNASRTPVSRALRLLHSQGAVIHHENRGYFVADVPATARKLTQGEPAFDEISATYMAIAKDRLAARIPASVTETYLKSRYNLSKSQLNVLLSRIASEGWIERRTGYGWQFKEIMVTPEALAQTLRLRQAVEPASLLEPGYRLDRVVAAQCREVELEMLKGGIETMSAEALFARGVRFHECLVSGGQNPFFLETIRRVNRIRRLLTETATRDRRRFRQHCLEHLELLDLLEQERNEEASVVLRHHLENVEKSYDQIRDILVVPT